ncbi:hypothetical protein PMAYCL1PPCAC_03846, partial [Pristionchus mayeri]
DILDHGKDKTELLQKELLWIKALNTAYPFDKINNRLNFKQNEIRNHKIFSYKVSQLHKDFVVTMVDKASGNYAFTCKKLYLKFMEKDLNTTSDGNRTYALKSHILPIDIKTNHERFTRSHFRRYSENITSHDRINRLFSIQNTFKVVQQLSTVHNPNSKIFCADFSSLFTNLHHDVVREKLYYLIDLLFKNAGSEYLVVQGNCIRYDRNNSSSSGRSYHKVDIKGIIDFILKNSYAYYGEHLYQQNKGIPQGNNASPQIADLTLAVMEFQYIQNQIKVGHSLSYSLNRTFRYIDDLFHISGKANDFIRMTTDMYHQSLTLEQTNTNLYEAAFLDLSISILKTGKVQTSLYNKTDDYSFSVIRYPHFESNIPMSMGVNTLHGEIIRIFRNCSSFEHFLDRVHQLSRYFITIKNPKDIVFYRIYKTLNNNPNIALKYAQPNNEICLQIINGI